MYGELTTKITAETILLNLPFLLTLTFIVILTYYLNKKEKGIYVPVGCTLLLTFLVPQITKTKNCSLSLLTSCTVKDGLTWILLIDTFLILITSLIIVFIGNIINKKNKNELADTIIKKQEEFIKNPNKIINNK